MKIHYRAAPPPQPGDKYVKHIYHPGPNFRWVAIVTAFYKNPPILRQILQPSHEDFTEAGYHC
jgi:hypothetical protein